MGQKRQTYWVDLGSVNINVGLSLADNDYAAILTDLGMDPTPPTSGLALKQTLEEALSNFSAAGLALIEVRTEGDATNPSGERRILPVAPSKLTGIQGMVGKQMNGRTITRVGFPNPFSGRYPH